MTEIEEPLTVIPLDETGEVSVQETPNPPHGHPVQWLRPFDVFQKSRARNIQSTISPFFQKFDLHSKASKKLVIPLTSMK